MHRSPPYCRYAPTSQFVVTMRLDKRKSGSWRATGMGSSTALFVGHWAHEGKMPGAFSDLPGKSMQKDGATRLIPPASFNWCRFGLTLQQPPEARVGAERVPSGGDVQQPTRPPKRPK